MIRQPTPWARQIAWHTASLAGERPPRVEDEPHVGFYYRRFKKNGPKVPVRIWLEQMIDPETGELTEPEELRASVGGQAADPVRIWPYCRPISNADYDALVEMTAREAVMAATHVPIDLSRNPIGPTQ